jgi:hypothetical protein
MTSARRTAADAAAGLWSPSDADRVLAIAVHQRDAARRQRAVAREMAALAGEMFATAGSRRPSARATGPRPDSCTASAVDHER